MMQQNKLGGEPEDEDVATRNYGSAMIALGPDYQPGESDVMVGRGKMCREWSGNARFRDLVASRLDEYSSASSKLEKSAIVTSVLFAVRTKSPNGGFIKKDPLTGEWYEVGDFVARERVTQSFRDALHDKYRSSNSSKKKRRKEELKKAKAEQAAESPVKKAKTEPPALRAAPVPASQSSLAGLQGSVNAASMAIDHQAPFMLQPRSLASASMSSNLPALAPSSNFASGISLLEPSAQQEGLGQQFQAFQMLNRGSGNSASDIFQHQLQALQGLSEGPGTQAQAESYPQSWFSVNQQQAPPSLSRMASASSSVAAQGSMSQGHGIPTLQGTATSAALLGSPTTASNPTSALSGSTAIGGDVGSTLLGSSATTATGSAPSGLLPLMSHSNHDMTPSLLAAAPVSFGAYGADDNPFEPVPIAENISKRNSSRGGEQDSEEKTTG